MNGLILGRIDDPWPGLLAAMAGLFNPGLDSETACKRLVGRIRAAGYNKLPPPLVTLGNAVHILVCAPTGVGKSASVSTPFLMTCPDSSVVVDFKGELALATARHRERYFGHHAVILDPYEVVTPKLGRRPDSLNVLDVIEKNSPHALDDCRDAGNCLMVRSEKDGGDSRHFLDTAEDLITAVIAVTVQHGQQGTRSLQTVRDILSSPEKLDTAIRLMQESPEVWGGMLARMGNAQTHLREKELASTLTTAGRMLRFQDSPAVAACMSSSSFSIAPLLKGKMTVYLVVPPERAAALAGLLRSWVGFFLRVAIRGGLQEKNKIHYVLEESSTLGQMDQIADVLAIGRSFGARLQFYQQSLGQLKKCWGEGQDQTLLSNTTQVFFGVNDLQTAEYVSNRCGEWTNVVTSGGTSSGTSRQVSDGKQPSTSVGSSHNCNDNWQQQARKLLKPEEVMTLPERVAISFCPGMPPVKTTLIRHYEEPTLLRPRGWLRRQWEGFTMLANAIILLGCVLLLGAVLLLAGR